jgi:hypothetical protein
VPQESTATTSSIGSLFKWRGTAGCFALVVVVVVVLVLDPSGEDEDEDGSESQLF